MIKDTLYSGLKLYEDPEKTYTKEARLDLMLPPLLRWYQGAARSLPWRNGVTPYRVWISEIMLQQTRVEAVKPYYARFMERLPDIESLARIEDDLLMKLWEGLGYYSRARNLKKAAILCMEQHGGRLPECYEELLELPGIGSYTAGAIASIACGQRVPAVDGNVLRVMTRVTGDFSDITLPKVKRQMEEDIQALLDRQRPDSAAFTQAVMELGACVCVPNGAPHCEECPIAGICLASQRGLTGTIPVKTPKKGRKVVERTILIITDGERVAIHKRPEKGLLAGLYEFPALEEVLSAERVRAYCEGLHALKGAKGSLTRLPDGKHIFTHIEWHMQAYEWRIPGDLFADGEQIGAEEEEWQFVGKNDLQERYAFPSAFRTWEQL